MKVIIYSFLHLPKCIRMEKIALPLLCLFAFFWQACSDDPSAKASKKQQKEYDTSVYAIGERYKDSLRGYMTDLAGVTDIKALLCQQWEHEEDRKVLRGSGPSRYPYRGFAFFSDGTMVLSPRDFLMPGKWSYADADKMITVSLADGRTSRYKIKALAADELVLLDKGESGASPETYVGQAFTHNRPEDDPFHPSNIAWRNKPRQPESPAAIAKRVGGCIHFYRLFYNDNLMRDNKQISFAGLPSCFNWYYGGIGVQKAEKLEGDWVDCFYDRKQALQAHAMLEKLITEKFHWTKGEFDWRVKTVKVLQQMDDRWAMREGELTVDSR
jgi:hypothetical protein